MFRFSLGGLLSRSQKIHMQFIVSWTITNGLQLAKELDEEYFFTQRVVMIWNVLPERMMEMGSLVSFKRKLDISLTSKHLHGYWKIVGLISRSLKGWYMPDVLNVQN